MNVFQTIGVIIAMQLVILTLVYAMFIAVPEPLTLKERAEYECMQGLSEAACDWLEEN